jgi:hypothetical protein
VFDKQYIGGRWRSGGAGRANRDANSWTGEVLTASGEKNTGIGRFNGGWAVDAFTSDHRVTVQHVYRRYPTDARELRGPWGGG